MKKVLSLALVLCMAVACFAFAPTSAETYRGNILTTTEETVSVIPAAAPWSQFAAEGNIATWSFPFDLMYASGEADNQPSVVWTFQDDVLIPGENRFGDAQALQFDLSKSVACVDNPGVWGYKLDIYTNKLEAGKTYTFAFMVKGTADFSQTVKATILPEGNFANNGVTGAGDWVTITDEWTMVKYTFVAGASVGCFSIVIGEPVDVTEGYIYVDGIIAVEGNGADLDATFYEKNFRDPSDIDGDGLMSDEDIDVDGDEIPNQFDNDIDNDGVKNVWDRDIDTDGIANGADENPFGMVTSFVVIG